MSTFRVVLYAEGAGETGGERRLLPPPGAQLEEDHLGAAHLLLRRCLQQDMNGSDREIVFEAPLRERARTARGSDFLRRSTLRQLLTWFTPEEQPDCAVVLVDQDGDRQRKRKLEEDTQDLPSRPVIGVAIQEFEAWLIADHVCVAEILERKISTPNSPEKMPRRKAKETLAGWIESSTDHKENDEIRRQIAASCDLEKLARSCPAFLEFSKALTRRLNDVVSSR